MKTFRIALDIYGEYTVYIFDAGESIKQLTKKSYELDDCVVYVSHPIEAIEPFDEHLKSGIPLSDWVS